MREWLVVLDVSGSLLANAKAEVAGECLRCLLQEESVKPDNIYLWGADVLPWMPELIKDPAAWRGMFSGVCSLESLSAALQVKGSPALVISDGYVFHDASPLEKQRFKEVKTDRVLLLLEQERRLNLRAFWNEDAIFSPETLLVLSDWLRADGQGM